MCIKIINIFWGNEKAVPQTHELQTAHHNQNHVIKGYKRERPLWDWTQAKEICANSPEPMTSTRAGPKHQPPQKQVQGSTTKGVGLSQRPLRDWVQARDLWEQAHTMNTCGNRPQPATSSGRPEAVTSAGIGLSQQPLPEQAQHSEPPQEQVQGSNHWASSPKSETSVGSGPSQVHLWEQAWSRDLH